MDTFTTPRWTLSDRFRLARRQVGLSAEKMAEAAGQHPNTIRSWERGIRTPPNLLEVCETYERITGFDRWWLLLGDELQNFEQEHAPRSERWRILEEAFRTGSFSDDFDALGIDIAA